MKAPDEAVWSVLDEFNFGDGVINAGDVDAERMATEIIHLREERQPWWLHHPDHMKGWEAFGISGRVPTVRQLGVGYDGKQEPGTTPWGKGEVKLGVAGIHIGTFADSPDGAYIYVVGTTREDVEARYHAAVDAFAHIQLMLWPSRRIIDA